MKSRCLIIFLLFVSHLAFSQTATETKEYIKDRVKSNPSRGYELDVIYGDELLPYHYELVTGEDFNEEIQKRTLVIERTIINNGKSLLTVLDVFDIKGISSVNIANQKASNGENIKIIKISLKEEFLLKTRISRGEGKYEDKPRRNSIEIALIMSDEDAESLKKAFLHLSKSFGGAPVNEKLF